MRASPVIAVLVLLPAIALGQVTTNQNALDRLGPAKKATHAHVHAPHATHARAHPPVRTGTTTRTAARIGPAPTIPPRPPPPPVIAPPAVHVDLHPPPPPPAVPVVVKAIGSASSIRAGMRITFGSDSADVNAETDAALHGVATMLKAEPNVTAEVDAFAAGTEDDPSSPRRVSLARALAARAVLINDGIASTRIYARALGASAAPASDTEPQGPPDRVDIVMRDPNAASAPASAKASHS